MDAGPPSLTGLDSLSRNIHDQLLSCKICLEGLKEPKSLPCLHTFCADCLHIYIEHNLVDAVKFACPICRRNIYIPRNGVDGFPDSFFVASLADLVQEKLVDKHCGICKFKSRRLAAAALCIECKIELCDSCVETHSESKITEGHTLLPLAPPEDSATAHGGMATPNRDNYCRLHSSEVIKYYCSACKTPICLPCTFLEHRGHEVEELSNIRQKCATSMQDLMERSQASVEKLDRDKSRLIQLETELYTRREQIKTSIRKAVQKVHRSLNEREAILMNELDDACDFVGVSQDRQHVERACYRLSMAKEYVEQLLAQETSPITQILNHNDAHSRLEAALQYDPPDMDSYSNLLEQTLHFLPEETHVNLGTILKCSGHGDDSSCNTSSLQCVRPSTKAIYVHQLKLADGAIHMGEVISLGILPSNNVVLLINALDDNYKVKIFSRIGRLKCEFGDDLQNPSDLAITEGGLLALTDCGDVSVKVFNFMGTERLRFGDREMFELPVAITTDNLGRYLVCDQAKQRLTIHRHNDGELQVSININQVRMPQFIKCNNSYVYIADAEHNEIAIFTYNAMSESIQFTTKICTTDDAGGEILNCSGIALDQVGNLLVADATLNRVHVLSRQGDLSNIVTSGKSLFRPSCIDTCKDNLLAIVSQGVESLDTSSSLSHTVAVYRLHPVDK